MTFPLMPNASGYSPSLEASYLGGYNTSSTSATINAGTFSFGDEDPTREIFVCFTYGGNIDETLSSATIGGVSAVVHEHRRYCLVSAHVPTGSSGSITLNLTGTIDGSGLVAVGVYRIANRRKGVDTLIPSISIGSPYTTSVLLTHSYPLNAVGLVCAFSNNQNGSTPPNAVIEPPYTKLNRISNSVNFTNGVETYTAHNLTKTTSAQSVNYEISSFGVTGALGGALFIIE
jgi:hypothetical protein